MTATPSSEPRRIALLVHEVRNPTAALSAISAALGGGPVDDDSLRSLIALAVAACRSIERVVGDAALGALDLTDVDVGTVARDAAAGAELGGADIRCVLGEGPLVVRGDALRLRQALDNLVGNAVAHARPGGGIRVEARREERFVLVSVADRGGGIPAEDQARIFEPGVRLDPSRPGSGLGLAIARSIVEAHGGRLSVASEPGRGATFTMALPNAGA